jgi:hypothetical protein
VARAGRARSAARRRAAETYPEEHWPTQIADALRRLIHQTNLARGHRHIPLLASATREAWLPAVLAAVLAITRRGHR